ncbi:hypothetical protein SORBI_3005G157866 [Sorghum bicolor]|uniref:F-box domain-containing protein n=1 Tax=Sorghum bicolor TaxID=4558 RepID=A0A1Z5RIT7_SORBI|nr:hypothetical protein SORBI_3005G157866 [Sorghum bicolor]
MEDTIAEKKPRTAGDRDGDGCNSEPERRLGGRLAERLPEALLVEVLGRLDLDDACSAAASCRSLHAAANVALSALDLSVSFTLKKKEPEVEADTRTGGGQIFQARIKFS